MNDAVGLDIECEFCDDPAGYESVDFYYTYGLDGDGLFSSCIPNLCSELEAQICGPGETLLVCSCTALEPDVRILARLTSVGFVTSNLLFCGSAPHCECPALWDRYHPAYPFGNMSRVVCFDNTFFHNNSN